MTLVDVALEILREQAIALTAAQLAEAAVASGRVAKATPAQVKSLADRLAKLAAAGEVKRSGDAFAAANGTGKKKTSKKPPAKKAPAPARKKPPTKRTRTKKDTLPMPAPIPEELRAEPEASEPILIPEIVDDDEDDLVAALPPDLDDDDDEDDDEDDDFEAEVALGGFAEAPAAEVGRETVDEALASDDEDVAHEAISHALSPEEAELAAVYKDEMSSPATAHGEYKDARSADEDRPIMPEINAREERQKKWETERRERRERDRAERRERRERREQREQREREQKDRPDARPGGNGHRGEAPRPVAVAPIAAATAAHAEPGVHRVGTPLGDAAAQVFAQLRSAQPLPVRQLAAMMRKRGLIEADPEQVWPHLKASLLGDERSYRALGLRPRIVYRGRDLFAPGPVALAATATAETSLATALGGLAMATHAALKERIARATPAGFERLVHAYLVAIGYNEIEWVKRVAGISYATALLPDADRQVLISARSGGDPVDRRGIGELRVGVEAKNLLLGVLFSAREMSDDAQRELEKPGRSISVVCGDTLVAALIGAGVGVVSAAAPIHYVDDQLLDELLAGG